MKKTKVYSVRLKNLTQISAKCWKAEDWQGNITWARDFDFNYSKDQILFKNKLKREDEIIKKWTSLL